MTTVATRPPQLIFCIPDGTIIHKGQGMVPLKFSFWAYDELDLRSAVASGAHESVSSDYPSGIKAASLTLEWHVSFWPAGSYQFTLTATDTAGIVNSKTITLHLED